MVDDYGHHPTEVEAVIATARAMWPERRLVMCYQPHRYSRTRDLYDEFVRVLSAVDVLVCLEVYAAGEAPIAGADARKRSVRALRQRCKPDSDLRSESPTDALQVLEDIGESDDVVLVQGAGNVNVISNVLTEVSKMAKLASLQLLVVCMLALAVVVYVHLDQPVETVLIRGQLDDAERQQVQAAVRSSLDGGLLSSDLAALSGGHPRARAGHVRLPFAGTGPVRWSSRWRNRRW